jgi:hypothetical protein
MATAFLDNHVTHLGLRLRSLSHVQSTTWEFHLLPPWVWPLRYLKFLQDTSCTHHFPGNDHIVSQVNVDHLFLVATVNAPRVESPSSFVWGAITWSAGASRETKINSYRLHWASLHAEGPLVRSENLLLMIFWPPSTWNRRLHPSCSDNILAWFCLSICLMNDLQTQSKLNGRYCCPSVGSPVWTEPTKKEIQTWILHMVRQASLKYMKQSFVFWTILINSF